MESLIQLLQGSLSFIVPMIVLLGLLIFVHELGHFLVAKYFKVRVEVFSLGFGPKIFKFKRGDTVYAISAIPLGGYVKMFGDDPTAEISAEQKAYSFTHKPVGQRIAVVLAGPLMNFFFAIILFAGVALLGEQTLSPQIGDIAPETPAYAAGFRSGDKVVLANSQPVQSWEDFQKQIENHANQTLNIKIERVDGSSADLSVTPKSATNKNVLSWDRTVGEIEGLTFSSRAPVIGVQNPQSPAAIAGLQTGDVVVEVDGVKVAKWRDFVNELGKHTSSEKIRLTVERGHFEEKKEGSAEKAISPTPIEVTAQAAHGLTGEPALAALGIEFPELYLAGTEKDSPAAQAGLKKGDRIVSIDGQEVQTFEQVANIIRSHGQSSTEVKTDAPGTVPPLRLVVLRNGERQELAVSPNVRERMSPQGREEKRFEIGIHRILLEAPPSTFIASTTNPIDAISRGFSQTMKWTSLTVLSFVRLFQNEVSAKNIGGFISIGQMAKKSWQIGASPFLNIMAIISINLFILNLLPVPVLDGGHLVFYSIEAVKGAPLSMRKMEIAQQVGLVLLLSLMVFAIFNDVTRLFNNW